MIPAVVGIGAGAILLLSRGQEESAEPLQANSFSHHDDGIEIPLALMRKQWIDFLKSAICGNPRTVSSNFRLGTFGFSVRRLCDLGAMKNPRAIWFSGRRVWDGDWIKPSSLRAFQSAPMEQYRLFVASIKRYFVCPEVGNTIGKIVDGEKVTLSGALMLANRAGISGMQSWLEKPEDRKRYNENTTVFFYKSNGIF